MKIPVHVLPTRNGKWAVKSAGKRRHRILDTFAEAFVIGRRIAINRKCELICQRTDGTIRSKDSFGRDPFPPLEIRSCQGAS